MALEFEKIDEERIDAACQNSYVYTLKSVTMKNNANHFKIYVSKAPSIHGMDIRFAFMCEFREEAGMKYFKISSLSKQGTQEMWKSSLPDCTHLKDLARSYFLKIIKLLNTQFDRMMNQQPPLEDDLKNLKNLFSLKAEPNLEGIPERLVNGSTENLLLYGNYSSTRGVLSLMCDDVVKMVTGKRKAIMNMRKRLDVTTFLYSPFSIINSNEIMKLRAAQSYINIGNLTPSDISEFVEAWREGKLRNNFEWIVWNVKNSQHAQKTIGQFFYGPKNTSEKTFVMRQYKNSNVVARLYCHGDEIRFFVEQPSATEEKPEFSICSVFKTFFKAPIAEKSEKPIF